MTCEEALRLLYDVIDKESSQIDSEKVKEHLNGCRHCMARYEFEAMFKTFVVDKAASKTKSDQLRNKILSRLEDAERNPETISAKPARNKYRLFFLSAAALIVFVVAALSVTQMYRHQTFVYPFEKNHLDGNADSGGNPDTGLAMSSLINALSADYSLKLTENVLDYNLIKAGFDNIENRNFMHLHYLVGDAPVSVYIGRDDNLSLRDFKKMVYAGHEYFQHICARCQVIYWRLGDKIIVAVSANKEAELPVLMTAVEAI
jgi:mycothiol system anti-sigma-R factor